MPRAVTSQKRMREERTASEEKGDQPGDGRTVRRRTSSQGKEEPSTMHERGTEEDTAEDLLSLSPCTYCHIYRQ
ncbi:hypothetical protein CPLU01_00319 [Colletotrichum plurivorum]|uniref:Uncharacterized protein n=1 Tax=Colletotrichum plurivorum TaxID=2175906 RepID=A0A8H6NS80_9PEZI|nr:hypothetical protein CPLU01_00319 [Colletotrichum plurivorum]